jgi:hypothetical protein
MLKITGLILAAGTQLSLAYAAEWTGEHKPLQATYSIYSGQPGEREAPTAKDRKLVIIVDRSAAKDIFDSLGPDSRHACSGEPGYRERRRNGVVCNFSPQAPGKGYRCWIGIDLRTGESMTAVSC